MKTQDVKKKWSKKKIVGVLGFYVVLPLILLLVLFLLLKSSDKRKAVEEQNTRTKTVSCQVVDKYYFTPDAGGRAIPQLRLSFDLEDDEVQKDNLTDNFTVEQAQFDKVFVGDTILCNVTYVPLKYAYNSHGFGKYPESKGAKVLKVEIVGEE